MGFSAFLGWFLPFVINLSICHLYNYCLSSWVSEWTSSLLIPSSGIQATHCASQNSSDKTDGALLPGNLWSGFPLESATSGSDFPELKLRSVGEVVPLALHEELLRPDTGKTAAAATRVALATRGAPPLGIG